MAVRAPLPDLLKFLSAYDPKIVDLALSLRQLVLTEIPTASESIYDAYEAVSIGFSETGRLKEGFCHIAVYANHVNLGLNRGTELPDPKKLLQGTGRFTRHITFREKSEMKRPYVRRFIRLARMNSKGLAAVGKIPLIAPQSVVKAIYAKKLRPVRG
jgi:hypothetical protein